MQISGNMEIFVGQETLAKLKLTSVGAGARAIPLYDTVRAGLLKDAAVVDAADDVLTITVAEEDLGGDPNAFALIVQGDSMAEAGIFDGDVVVVSRARPVNAGDIAVVQVGGQTTLKKVYINDDQVVLQAANWRYEAQVLAYPQQVEILGRVILVRRKL